MEFAQIHRLQTDFNTKFKFTEVCRELKWDFPFDNEYESA